MVEAVGRSRTRSLCRAGVLAVSVSGSDAPTDEQPEAESDRDHDGVPPRHVLSMCRYPALLEALPTTAGAARSSGNLRGGSDDLAACLRMAPYGRIGLWPVAGRPSRLGEAAGGSIMEREYFEFIEGQGDMFRFSQAVRVGDSISVAGSGRRRMEGRTCPPPPWSRYRGSHSRKPRLRCA